MKNTQIEFGSRRPASKQTENKRKPQSKNSVRVFFGSPSFNVSALVLLLLAVFGGLRYLNSRKPPAQINFVETENAANTPDSESETANRVLPVVFSGEVYSTSLRLREIGALGMAMTLAIFAASHEIGSLPADADQILNEIAKRKLMPPGLKFENNRLTSDSSAFSVRYQQSPFRFEILSKPHQTADGPALLLRFPLGSLDGRTITYFQSASVSGYRLPEPFAPFDQIVATGWTIEQWRGEILPDDKQNYDLLAEEKRLLEQLPKNR